MNSDNNFSLDDPFVQFVKEAALAKIPGLEPGKIYISEDILEAIWDETSENEHKTYGKALKYLCDMNQLPLIMLKEKTGDNRRQYKLAI